MKRLLFLLGLVGVLLCPCIAWAADGDACLNTDNAAVPLASRGSWAPIACVKLCDAKAAADSTCTEYDFNSGPGMPDLVILEYEEDPDAANCSATPDYTFTTGPISVVGLANAPTYDLDTTAVVMNPTTNRVIIITENAPLDRFLFTAIADDADCTDVDILMFLYDRKAR